MTKYIESERFIVSSNSKEAIKNYADNYDRIFGKKDEPPAFDGPFCTGCGVGLDVEPTKALCCTECYRHDAGCAKLCTEGADCDCGIE